MTFKMIKRNGKYFISESEISSQYLGIGETKKEALEDYVDTLYKIFSNPKERKYYMKKYRGK